MSTLSPSLGIQKSSLHTLVEFEINALTELAYQNLELQNISVWAKNYENGLEFHSFVLQKDDLTSLEINVVNDLLKLTELNTYFAGGFDTASKAYEFATFRTNEDFEDESLNSLKVEISNLDKVLADISKQLLRFEQELRNVNCYSDLLTLDKSVLALLVAFEEASVSRFEMNNEYPDGSTSGHHRDCLYLYQSALAGITKPQGCFVYMSDDGTFHFNILDSLIS